MKRWHWGLLGCFVLIAFTLFFQEHLRPPSSRAIERQEPLRVVLWISIDGIRHDYIERSSTPFIDELLKESLYTNQFKPIFPSVTFATHISQATGTYPAEHGVPNNVFYDSQTKEFYNYPSQSSLLEAEPIWLTAQRQGLRTAVVDWPLSHNQQGEITTDYFLQKYISDYSDSQRLQQVVEIWKQDSQKAHEKPLQLLMAYAVGPDSAGHQYGPASNEVEEKMSELDETLEHIVSQVLEHWESNMIAEDELYLLVTTDHGMSPVEKLVNPEELTGLVDRMDIPMYTGGPICYIHLDSLEGDARKQKKKELIERVSNYPFAKIYQPEEVPRLAHPTRFGDLMISLKQPYSFSRYKAELVYPVEQAGGPLGTHGYHPGENDDMNGWLLLWRYPQGFEQENLGEVSSLDLHPTVAKILEIKSSERAKSDGLELHPIKEH